jgi:succinoglycan biosynthesis transport protein ExoP
MLEELRAQGPSTLQDYVQILWRHKWLIAQAVVLVPIAAVLWSERAPTRYTASAGVLMQTANLGANIAGVQDPTQINPNRVIQTQIPVARLPIVARMAIRAAGLTNWSPSDLLGESTVSSSPDSSDILTFSVTDLHAERAVRLTNEYARQFTRYRRELDTAAIASARDAVSRRMHKLEAAGRRGSALYANLVVTDQRLSTLEALQTSRAVLVRPATGAAKQGPNLKKDGAFGLALALLLGFGLAFAREALDTRVRSADVVSRDLNLLLLGRVSTPPRRLRRRKKLVTLSEPFGSRSEAFRMLAPNIEFANMKLQARVIMMTSAVESEGKSTTAANLAVAFARAGARVALVDLDPYSSPLDDFFDISGRADGMPRAGLTDVILGKSRLDAALSEIDISPGRWPVGDWSLNGRRAGLMRGRLDVLRWGDGPPEVASLEAETPLRAVLERLKARADLVLLDSPPLLRTADALNASSQVDALLLVVRLNLIRRATLAELRRVLESCPPPKLGFIATGADTAPENRYSEYSYFERHVPGHPKPPGVPSSAHDSESVPLQHEELGERDRSS